MRMTRRILLVDLSALFWRNWHATKDQEIGEAFALTVNAITARKRDYERCVVCCDVAPYKRKAISADYKAQRDAPDPVAVGQLTRVKERLASDGLAIVGVKGYEADDIIATICAKVDGDESDIAVDILTGDKDLMALVNDRINLIHLASGDRFGPSEVVAKMGVPPDTIPALLALCGDKADNVPGCPGIGPKKSAQLIADNGGIANIIDGELVATGATRDAVLANREQIRKSLELVTLMTDAPIDIDEVMAPREPKQLQEIAGVEFEEPIQEQPKPDVTIPAPTAIELAAPVAIAKAAPSSFEMSLEPATTGQAWALAKAIHQSRLFAVESAEQALMILMTGREMGIGAMASLRGFHFIKGKPCMSAQLMAALILRSGKAEYWELIESSPKSATYATKRIGGRNEQRKTFTVDDARLAQLVKSDGNWTKYPAAMCEARAGSALARIVYPDLLAGVYLPGEIEES